MTKQKFSRYVDIQKSGLTNMWAIDLVISLSGNILTEQDCLDIMKNYKNYQEKYKIA